MKFPPNPVRTVDFEVETLDGKTIEFAIPALECRTRKEQATIDEWVQNERSTKDGHDLFIFVVSLYDKTASKALDKADVQRAQIEAMLDHYQAESKVTEGESEASSDS